LESSGMLYKVDRAGNSKKIKLFKDGFDMEGLCFHKKRESLLLACKKHPGIIEDRFVWVYEYSLRTKELKEEPFLKLPRSKIAKDFRPSGVSISANGNLLLTSATNESIAEFSVNQEFLSYTKLPRKEFPQVEGFSVKSDREFYLVSEKSSMRNAKFYQLKLK